MVAQRLLDLLGLSCDAVENGKLAIERLADQRYDAWLMDGQMPIMDCYGATRLWREHEEQLGAGRLPIIAMTANAMAGDRQKCLEAGMDDYLAKPVTREQLLATLARWIPQTPQTPASEAATLAPAVASRSEEHTSELQSLMRISDAVFCLKTKTKQHEQKHNINT